MSAAQQLTGQAPDEGFAEAMSTLASGVVLVTCWVGGRPWGMTVTAVASVSADPPTVLVSLGVETTAARAIGRTRAFGVSILAADQVALARYGAVPGAGKFLDAFVEPGLPGESSPAVRGALAHLDCALSERVEVADHEVLFGLVRDSRTSPTAGPLVYQRRGYRTLAPSPLPNPSAGRNVTCLWR